jgi:hypothetical protein
MVMMKIDIDEIKSSNIAGITFTAEKNNDDFVSHGSVTGDLLVEYSTGAVYRYFDVHFAAFLNIFAGPSVGSNVFKSLKTYRYEKVYNGV